jgi:YrbI family 3-deoxy-D-manno-octulosonate 8-phosphate phosphatase
MDLDQRCQSIKLLLSDVDGVLTDGRIVYDSRGVETARFHVRDGLGVQIWHRAGCHFGLVSSRDSSTVPFRAREIGVVIVKQGARDKPTAIREIQDELQLTWQQTAYIGDDLLDLPVMRLTGLAVAVADAADEVRRAAHLTTRLPGGEGAVREVIETILKGQRRWDELIERLLAA